MLLELLADRARREGIERFSFVALPENTALAGLLARYGSQPHIEDGLATYTLETRPRVVTHTQRGLRPTDSVGPTDDVN
jgi:hypothetical protein